METAKTIKNAVRVINSQVIEGNLCFTTDCADFQAYQRLPVAVTYKGKKLVKTGWNSDTLIAHYQESDDFAVATVGELQDEIVGILNGFWRDTFTMIEATEKIMKLVVGK